MIKINSELLNQFAKEGLATNEGIAVDSKLWSLFQIGQRPSPVPFAFEDSFSSLAPRRDVIKSTRIFYSKRSGYGLVSRLLLCVLLITASGSPICKY